MKEKMLENNGNEVKITYECWLVNGLVEGEDASFFTVEHSFCVSAPNV